MKDCRAERDCSIEEITHGGTIGRGEGDVTLSGTLSSGEGTDPEFRLPFASETNDLPKVHDPLSAHCGKNSIVESGTRFNICALD
jgi:hypothetical protein